MYKYLFFSWQNEFKDYTNIWLRRRNIRGRVSPNRVARYLGSSGAFPNSFLSGPQKSRKLRNALRQRRTHGTRMFLRNFSAAEFSVCSLGLRPLNAVLVGELTSNLVFLCTKVSHPRVKLACPHPLKPLSKLFSHLCSVAPKARKSFPSSSTPKKRKKRNRPPTPPIDSPIR